jgi:hypothetical protein
LVADPADHLGVGLANATGHGTNVPRGLESTAEASPGRGRFGRMFPKLAAAELAPSTIRALVNLMSGSGGEDSDVPAGYTYLGQFIDHDITFDPMSKLGAVNDPEKLVDFRTPSLDLDSLYGSGPKDQPFLYDWSPRDHAGAKLLVGSSAGDGEVVLDLPRNEQGRALIGDGRNDENLIISQLHLLFIRFHNKVVDYLRAKHHGWGPMTLFEQARHRVRWHYQWIVMHDFLFRIGGEDVARRALAERTYFKCEDGPFIPVEFSGAAYRFGHSMVRPSYQLNRLRQRPVPIFDRNRSDEPDSLDGLRRLPVNLAIDWAFFFSMSDEHSPDSTQAQPSRRIDTFFGDGLFRLPPDVAPEPKLPLLNLRRGLALGLPSGRDVACKMTGKALTDQQLQVDRLPEPVRDAVRSAPPLWYYVLCEAQSELGDEGLRLGPVGGRIVAEVLAGLLEADPSSYVNRQPRWTPTLPRAARGDFTMPDLVRFALGEPPPDALPPGR